MNNNLPTVKINFEEAKKMADQVGIIEDLKFAIECSKKLINIPEEEKQRQQLQTRALWSSALISYVRCFSTGKRYGIDPKIFNSYKRKGALKAHEYFKNLRDKHIAHSVNPFEKNIIGLILENEIKEKKILGVARLGRTLLSPGEDDIKTFMELSVFAAQTTEKEIKQLEKAILKKAKKLSIEKLYKNERMRIVTPGEKDAGKSREY